MQNQTFPKFGFRRASCVVIGTFNIYVVQPDVLTAMHVIEGSPAPLVSGDLTSPGIRFETGGAIWTVRPDRLAVESTEPTIDCGSFVKKTLKSLCWTPVFAIGFNSEYCCEYSDELADRLSPQLRLPNVSEAAYCATQVAVKLHESQLHLQLLKRDEELHLSLNVHTDLAKRRANLTELSEFIEELCSKYIEYGCEARDLAKKLLSAEFDHG